MITGRTSRVVERRARDLRISDVVQRVGDKAAALRRLAESRGIPLERVAFVGDDLNDREAMRLAGISIAPADAVQEIRELADLVTESPGGRGVARESVEAILRARGVWEQSVNSYLEDLSERDRTRRG
jgi:3-deoxy-D-manno-octulosonate 8-phosphate phosphatase (KDO 8-P phosphatase)